MEFFSQEHKDIAEAQRHTLPERLEKIDHPDLHSEAGKLNGIKEIWLSKYFAVRVIHHKDGTERLQISKTTFDEKRNSWEGGITWDELQEVKSQCGRGDKLAVEVFPKDENVINEGNYRHLWIIPEEAPYIWAKKKNRLSPRYDEGQTSILSNPSWI